MERQKKVFQKLKEMFIKELVLATLDLDKKVRIEVDVSDYAMDSILFMEYKDRKWRPVAFLLKSLNETEKNYEIHNNKMLAVTRGLEN